MRLPHQVTTNRAFIVFAATCSMAAITVAAPPRNLVVTAEAPDLKTLPQNWTDAEANWFYNVAQGSKLLPLTWIAHLEQPDAEVKFLDPDHVRSLGYLPRTPDPIANPEGLPIGFVRDGDHLGFTCAACHTNQINFQGKGWLVDGAPTLADIETFQRRLTLALAKTAQDESKFARFATGVLGHDPPAPKIRQLRDDLKQMHATRDSYNDRNFPADGDTPFGPGRVDAFGAILNEVTEVFAQAPANRASANAPVSYPFLWDTPQHDRVQWNGVAENKDIPLLKHIVGTAHIGALGRNTGEVLGVFGTVDATREGTLLQLKGYPSSVNRTNLIAIEESLRKLWSPQWPHELPRIRDDLRDEGRALFRTHCQKCHDSSFRRDDPGRTVVAAMRAVGTDQTMARNFATRASASGVLMGRRAELTDLRRLRMREPAKDLLVHMVERVLVYPQQPHLFAVSPEELLVGFRFDLSYSIPAEITLGGGQVITGSFTNLDLVDQKLRSAVSKEAFRLKQAGRLFRQDLTNLNHFVSPDDAATQTDDNVSFSSATGAAGREVSFAQPVEIQFAYKGRPLNGIWATAPYLHNGSIPNLDELLKPPGKRLSKFRIGSREFDPTSVGFRIDEGAFEFDTTLPGNSNAGHDYGIEFSDEQRMQLIEYMKSL